VNQPQAEPDPRTPILVGCGDVTDLSTPVSTGRSPYDLIAQAARDALRDTGVAERVAPMIDYLCASLDLEF